MIHLPHPGASPYHHLQGEIAANLPDPLGGALYAVSKLSSGPDIISLEGVVRVDVFIVPEEDPFCIEESDIEIWKGSLETNSGPTHLAIAVLSDGSVKVAYYTIKEFLEFAGKYPSRIRCEEEEKVISTKDVLDNAPYVVGFRSRNAQEIYDRWVEVGDVRRTSRR